MKDNTYEENLNTGKIVYNIPEELYSKAARDFSEGNSELEKLLLQCFQQEIQTLACCAGHGENQSAYIRFKYDEKNMNVLLNLMKKIADSKKFELTLVSQPGDIPTSFQITSDYREADELFKIASEACIMEKNATYDDLSLVQQDMLRTMNAHNIPGSYLEMSEKYKNSIPEFFIASSEEDYIVEFFQEKSDRSEKYNYQAWIEGSEALAEMSESYAEKVMSDVARVAIVKERDRLRQKELNEEKEAIIPNILRQRYIEGDPFPKVIEANIGVNIQDYAKELFKLKAKGVPVIGYFNTINLDISSCKSPDEIVKLYDEEINKPKENAKDEKGINDIVKEIIEEQETTLEDVEFADTEEKNMKNAKEGGDVEK